jgi:hypothetical protein
VKSGLLVLMLACALLVFCLEGSCASDGQPPGFASDLHGKMIVGYQGWFATPGDDAWNKTWYHWSFKTPDPENLILDMWPAMDEYDNADCVPTGMVGSDRKPVCVYSSLSPGIALKHFQWMRDYGIDGVAYQRFVAELVNPFGTLRRDKVLSNVRSAAEATGRVFFVTYDVSDADEKRVFEDIEKDWRHLVNDLKITSSSSYMRHHGKPILQIWGFGFNDRPGNPAQVSRLLSRLKSGAEGLQAVTLVGGVPTCWRLRIGDARGDSAWANVYRQYDVISPWLVNRFGNEFTASFMVKTMVKPDLAEAKRLGVDYMPVIFPGFSRYNLKHCQNEPGKAVFNCVPRKSGKFYWKQVQELLDAHVDMLFGAMFDEVNEGTALYKVETNPDKLPKGARLWYPKLDGEDTPPDLYLRLTGLAAKYLKSGSDPPGFPEILSSGSSHHCPTRKLKMY